RVRQVLSAHVIFWAAAAAIPFAVVAVFRAAAGRSGSGLLFVELVLAQAAIAAVVPFFHTLYRNRGTAFGWIVLAISVLSISGFRVVPPSWLFDGLTGFTVLGAGFCIALAVGAWALVHDERL